jgi:glycosyltransferase involved in cell wall biosynthesis
MSPTGERPLRILHVLRAPLGGLLRHVLDIARGQAARGHLVGIIADSTVRQANAEAALAALAPGLALGIHRRAMAREIGPGDIVALTQVSRLVAAIDPDVLHGHGAKGGAYARLTRAASQAVRVYTPHGGSLGFRSGSVRGTFYRMLEGVLNWRTDLFLFESAYIADIFTTQVGTPRGLVRIVYNGVGGVEFAPIERRDGATDIVCVGELRNIKGIDVLLDALARLQQEGRRVTATIAGDGSEADALKAQAGRQGLSGQVRFVGHRPAREGFAMGRILVVPSRQESLPYVVLEAAAAGVPIIATKVGGIPEIFGPYAKSLIPPDDRDALVRSVGAALDNPAALNATAQAVQQRVRADFSLDAMVDGGLSAYRSALVARSPGSPANQSLKYVH